MENVDEEDLPDTGPVVEEEVAVVKTEDYWGKLIQLTNNGHNTRVLTEEVYRVGRAPSCELPISETDVDRAKYTLISKVHFKIERSAYESSYVVYLEDLSSNGTFVNEKKVGKNKKIPLQNSAEISLASPNLKMYLYIDSSHNSNNGNWLHPDLASQFYVLKPLGAGTFGDVRLVIDQQNCKQFAMKKILKEKMSENRILNEVNILKRLKHPGIVHLEGIYDSPEAVFITLEYVAGGNLLHKINKMKKIPEPECKVIFYQLLLGVEYLHNEGITHRDIKPENILINTNSQNDTIVKITDFGLSKIATSQTHLKTFCGTLKYVAPEIIANFKPTYDNKVDIWSLGVVLFVWKFFEDVQPKQNLSACCSRYNKNNKYKSWLKEETLKRTVMTYFDQCLNNFSYNYSFLSKREVPHIHRPFCETWFLEHRRSLKCVFPMKTEIQICSSLSGKYPFKSTDNRVELVNQIMSGKLNISRTTWTYVSKQAMRIIGKMLIVDPMKRFSVNDLLNHEWIDDDNLKERISYIVNEKSIEDLEPVLKKQKLM